MSRPLLFFACAIAAVLLLADPAWAGVGAWLGGLANRSRVIQVCMVVMLFALFVMMKKFSDR
ncbi:MAG: hypothetical protein ACRC33_06545 [Gemmataceae bacterium]